MQALAGAVLCRWKYHPRGDWRQLDPAAQALSREAQICAGGDFAGWVNHYNSSWAVGDSWLPIESSDLLALQRRAVDTGWSRWYRGQIPSASLTFEELQRDWSAQSGVQSLKMTRMFLHPSLCLSVLEDLHAALHSVALSRNRAPLRRRCLLDSPPKSLLRALVSRAADAGEEQIWSAKRRRFGNELSAEEYVEYLEASRTSRSLRAMPDAGSIWGKLCAGAMQALSLSCPLRLLTRG